MGALYGAITLVDRHEGIAARRVVMRQDGEEVTENALKARRDFFNSADKLQETGMGMSESLTRQLEKLGLEVSPSDATAKGENADADDAAMDLKTIQNGGGGLLGQAIRDRELIFVRNISDDRRFNAAFDLALGTSGG